MNKSVRLILSVFAILSLVFGSFAMVSAVRGQQEQPAPIYLEAGTFVPGESEITTPPGLTIAGYPANTRGYYIVQFGGPVEQAWKDQVTALGADVLDYIPDFAFKVRMNPGQAKKVQQLANVSYVGIFQPAFKLNPSLAAAGELGVYSVRIERGAEYGLARAAIAQTGSELLQAEGELLTVIASRAQIEQIANVLDVAWVDFFYLNVTNGRLSNDVGGGSVMGSAAANVRGYDGSTQTVTVADTGIGGGTTTTAHRDIPGSRVTAIYNWPGSAGSCFQTITNDGSIDVDSGHGTHTASSVLSAGDPSGAGKGTSPAAHLVFQSTENYVVISSICKALYGYTDGYYLTGLPSDLKTLYQQAYNAGSRIHSNSWGSAQAGAYTTDSVNTDSFIWTNKDMVITFSAGNEGIDANSDGAIDNDSIGSPATAKNVITVGASENARPTYPCDTGLSYTQCGSQGGINSIFTYNSAWPADYPAEPIKSDPSAGNSEQMAAFSSRGPTNDSRIKPDVVAPGTWVLSGYSDLYEQGYDASPNPKNNAYQYDGWGFPLNAYYKYMGGTSMSNPLTAGGAAVLKDYFQKVYGISASAALVKAVMINTAVDIMDENNDGASDNDFPIPNNHEGWGRVNLDAATDGRVRYIEGSGLSTNGTASYQVTPTGGALKITIVWSDYPSTTSASVNLVNDLDLTVSGTAGNFLGNVFSGGWSATGGSVDRRNNVENVYIANPGAGPYTVQVKGYNVPNGPQPYALVVTGGELGSTSTATPGPTNTPTATATPTFTPTPTNTPAPTTNTGFLSPSANAAVTTGSGDNNGYQTSPANAYANDSAFASDASSGTNTNTSCTNTGKDRHIYYNYNVNLPVSAVIKGIQVRLDARVSSASSSPKICVQLSWDGGTTWTTAKSTTTLSTTERTYTLGGTTDTWGRTWTQANFSNTNLRVRIVDVAASSARTFYLDWIALQVTYQP